MTESRSGLWLTNFNTDSVNLHASIYNIQTEGFWVNSNIVLITGGTGAIGIAMCRQFASTGYRVFANCHESDRERGETLMAALSEDGIEVTLTVFDVTDHAACVAAIEYIEAEGGDLSVVVNAAGITRDATLLKLEPEQWSAVLRTNLDGVYNVTRACVAGMSERGYGRVINISSVNGQRGQFGQTNYSAAKAGMTGFTKALAREVARDGITVNSVSPGYVRSPMIQAIPEKVREKVIAQIPVGRFAEPDEIARVVVFLAHADSGYITGTDISVNGGFHIG